MAAVLQVGQEVDFRGETARILTVDADGKNVRLQKLSGGRPLWCEASELLGERSTVDGELSTVKLILRSKDPEVVEAMREMLLGEESEALKGLDAEERGLLLKAFDVNEGDIFEGYKEAAPDASTAVACVSPANSFGDMTGGIDAFYLKRFGRELMVKLQARIQEEKDGEMLVGDALIVETRPDEPVRYCVSAPTMRVPLDVRGTTNAYLAFRATLIAVRRHNRLAAAEGSGIVRIGVVLCPGLCVGVGLMPPRTVAYQIAMAYRQQVLGRKGCFESATVDQQEMVKSR